MPCFSKSCFWRRTYVQLSRQTRYVFFDFKAGFNRRKIFLTRVDISFFFLIFAIIKRKINLVKLFHLWLKWTWIFPGNYQFSQGSTSAIKGHLPQFQIWLVRKIFSKTWWPDSVAQKFTRQFLYSFWIFNRNESNENIFRWQKMFSWFTGFFDFAQIKTICSLNWIFLKVALYQTIEIS